MTPLPPDSPDHVLLAGESLAERVQRDGPLRAGPAWHLARQLLDALASLHALGIAHSDLGPTNILLLGDGGPEFSPVVVAANSSSPVGVAADPAAGSDATREDLRRLGMTLWFALTGDPFDPPPDGPLPWQKLDAAGITPALGALPVLLARTLSGDPAQCPATAPALLAALNVLASLASPVPSLSPMPSRAPSPDPVAPTPEPHPLAAGEGDLWTRPTSQLINPNRRRRRSGPLLRSFLLLVIGGGLGFFGGIAYERNRQRVTAAVAEPGPSPALASTPVPSPEPDLPLPLSPPVGAAGVAARLERIKSIQPDVRDVLKYARELRRVATLPVADADAFPTNIQIRRLLERFDWTDPASPDVRRTPLILVLSCAPEPSDATGQTASQTNADRMAQALAHHGVTSPIYTCGLGRSDDLPETELAGDKGGAFVEVWVAFTLF